MTKLQYDLIVVGGGHAGCEASSAAARMGLRTLLLTMDMTKLADMSCNPAIGGVAKGQIVREIDALGGQTGRIADFTSVQFRMLNRSKGAAMWSPRAQCDKSRFSERWRQALENTTNLYIWQDAATELLFDRRDAGLRIAGVRTRMGVEFAARAVILTSGTFLSGMMHCGAEQAEGGRAGDAASHGITECLRAVGFETGRMKTGTPARLDAGRSTSRRWSLNTATTSPASSRFRPIRSLSGINCPVSWFIPLPRYMLSCAEGSTARPCSTGRSPASARATVRASRTSYAPLPKKSNTSSFSNPRDARPTNITSTVSPPRFRGTCSSRRCTKSAVLRICTSSVRDMPSNTTIFHRCNCIIRSKPRRSRGFTSQGRSMAPRVTRRRRHRDSWPGSTPA